MVPAFNDSAGRLNQWLDQEDLILRDGDASRNRPLVRVAAARVGRLHPLMAAITPDQFHSVDFVPSRNPGCIEVHDDRLSANPRRSIDDEIPRRLTASRGTFPKRDLL